MGKERSGLGIDLEEVVNTSKIHSPTPATEAAILDSSEKAGFPSRQARAKRIRPKSPYTVQNNLKTRVGVKELLQEIGARLEVFDQSTFEKALIALVEKEGMKDLEKELKELIK